MSEHYTVEQWADYVRGLGKPEGRERMRTHLEAGCDECKSAVRWLQEVARIGALEAEMELSEEAIQRARILFRAPEPRDWIERLKQLAAELVFEAAPGWQPEGVRSAAGLGQRMLYQAGDYSVDLMLEPPEFEDWDIIGQIANRADPADNLEGTVVQILSGGETVGETEANRFGEFVIAQPQTKRAILRLALKRQGKRIDLPLQIRKQEAD